MPELVFADGRLLEGESDLASFDAAASVFSRGREYGVYRTSKHGWHHAVKAVDGGLLCAFEPFRIRRGGRLRSGSSVVRLAKHPLRWRSWRFSADSGQRVEVRVERRPQPARPLFASLRLRSSDSISAIPDASLLLLLGCWLVVNWERPLSATAPSSGVVWP